MAIDLEQKEQAITEDNYGGAVVAWSQLIASGAYDLYAQRIDADGNPGSTVDVPVLDGDVPSAMVVPNPATSNGCDFVLSGRVGGKLSAGIYDVSGRAVRRLATDVTSLSTIMRIHWDLRDDAGWFCRSGLYYLRCVVDGQAIAKRLAVMR
jgi:hypothetical protein